MTDTLVSMKDAVSMCADKMDSLRPDWYKHVDCDRLDQTDSKNCVASQSGFDWLNLHNEWASSGYATDGSPWASQTATAYWKEEIQKRLAPTLAVDRLAELEANLRRLSDEHNAAGDKLEEASRAYDAVDIAYTEARTQLRRYLKEVAERNNIDLY